MIPERQAVIDRLKFYLGLFDELMKMVDGDRPLANPEKNTARERLSLLKSVLKTEAGAMYRKRDEIDRFQRAFLEPALRQAHSHIITSAGTVPDRKWHTDLYGARIDISHMLDQIERVSDDWQPGGTH